MKVIMLKDVAKVGRRFDVKEVSAGFAQNMLIPQGSAIPATPANMKKYESQRKAMEAERKIHEDLLLKNIKDLEGVKLNISGKANEKGHLFAGIHKEEIVAELKKQTELQIDPSFIDMDHPLKEVGEHEVMVKGGGKVVKFVVVVEAVK